MDQFLSRQEIRRQILALSGTSTDAALNSQVIPEINILIDAAALKVAASSRWLTLQRRTSLPIGLRQQVLSWADIETARWMTENYPTYYRPGTFGTPNDSWTPPDLPVIQPVGPAGFLSAELWDEVALTYRPLRKQTLGPGIDYDRYLSRGSEQQVNDTAEGVTTEVQAENQARILEDLTNQCGRPELCHPTAAGLVLWPLTDQRYVIRVAYTVSPSWGYHEQTLTAAQVDQMPSVVDGLAVIFFALADYFDKQLDDYNGRKWAGRAKERMEQLRGQQATGERVRLDEAISFDDREPAIDALFPRWDTKVIIR